MRPEIDPTSFKECASAAWALALRPLAGVFARSRRWLRTITSTTFCTSRFMRRHLAITGVSLSGPIPGWGPVVSTLGEMLRGGDFSSQRLNPIHDTRRAWICGSQMLGVKCNPSVIAELPVTRPVYSPELHEGQLLSPVKHPARYRPRSAEILGILVSLGGRGHSSFLVPPA